MPSPAAPPPSEIPPFSPRLRDELAVLARLALPISLSQVALVAMGLVDTAIVGRVSARELAATAVGRSLTFAALSVCMGVTYAIEPLSAQAVGAGDPRRAFSALRVALRAALQLCGPALLVAFAATYLLGALGVDASLAPKVRAYLLGATPGQFAFVAFLAGKNFLQTHNRTRPALHAALAANALNAVVCSLLVLGDDALRAVRVPALGLPRLGSFGAGLASSVAASALAAWVLRAAWQHEPPSERGASEPPPSASEVVARREVLALGVPAGLQLLAEIGVFSLVALVAAKLGEVAVAAHQVAVGLASFTFMGALGVSGATATRVGHAIGLGVDPRRPGLLGIALGAAVMTLGATTFTLAPGPLVALFTRDPDVRATGVALLGIASLFQLFDGVQAVSAGALRGAGDVRFPFVANVAAHWCVGFPLALALGFGARLGAAGLWWGLTAGLVTVSLALSLRFVALTRRTVRTLDPHDDR